MKVFIKFFAGLVFLTAGAFSMGVRIHPENLSGSHSVTPSQYLKVQLTNGRKMAGKVLNESPEGLLIDFGGARMTLKNSEIASKTPLTDQDIQSGKYSEWLSAESPAASQSFVTFRASDNLWKQWKILPDVKKKGNARPPAAVWGARPKTAAAVPVSTPASSAASSAGGGSVVDIYKNSMSQESLEKYKQQMTDEMNAMPRNPFVEARDRAQEDAAEAERKKNEADTYKNL